MGIVGILMLQWGRKACHVGMVYTKLQCSEGSLSTQSHLTTCYASPPSLCIKPQGRVISAEGIGEVLVSYFTLLNARWVSGGIKLSSHCIMVHLQAYFMCSKKWATCLLLWGSSRIIGLAHTNVMKFQQKFVILRNQKNSLITSSNHVTSTDQSSRDTNVVRSRRTSRVNSIHSVWSVICFHIIFHQLRRLFHACPPI